LNLADDSRPES